MVGDRRGFPALWLAVTASGLGDGLRFTAIPLLAVAMSDRTDVVALVTAAGALPGFLFGLPAGVLVDRLDRRVVMWVTDLTRMVVAAAFVLLLLAGVRSVAMLAVFAFVMAIGQTAYSSALGPLLPSIVPRDDLTKANSRITGAQLLTIQLIGPALAGFVFAAGESLPFLIDALTFLASTLLLMSMTTPRRATPAPAPRASVFAQLTEGLQVIRRSATLRSQAIMEFVFSATTGMVLAVLVLHTSRTLGLPSVGYGLIVALAAVGGLAGTMATSALRTRFGSTPLLYAALAGTVVGLAILGAAPVTAATALAMFMIGATGVFWSIVTTTLRQESVPGELLGRVTSSYRMVRTGAMPLGAAAGGLIAEAVGLPAVFLGASALVALTGLACRRGFAARLEIATSGPPGKPGEQEITKDPRRD